MIRILILFLLISCSSFGQVPDTSAEEEWLFPMTPNMLCFEHVNPLFNLPDSLEKFEFILFNRWGEVYAQADDVDFNLLDVITVDESLFKDGVYTYVLKITYPGKEEQQIVGHFSFFKECGCG
jgi:hypothetical protein